MADHTGLFDEQAAEGYEAWYRTPEGRRADTLEKAALKEALESFSKAESVLEVGCGTGHFTRWLDGAGWQAAGLDLAAPMLVEAKRLNGMPLAQGDAHRLPFPDQAFDVTTMITTLEFLESPRAAVAEALRVGRQGMVLGVLNRCSPLAVQRRLEGLFRATIYDDARFYSLGDLMRLLRSAAGARDRISWVTTLFPRWWPWPRSLLPWGGFIVMALHRLPLAHAWPCNDQ